MNSQDVAPAVSCHYGVHSHTSLLQVPATVLPTVPARVRSSLPAPRKHPGAHSSRLRCLNLALRSTMQCPRTTHQLALSSHHLSHLLVFSFNQLIFSFFPILSNYANEITGSINELHFLNTYKNTSYHC